MFESVRKTMEDNKEMKQKIVTLEAQLSYKDRQLLELAGKLSIKCGEYDEMRTEKENQEGKAEALDSELKTKSDDYEDLKTTKDKLEHRLVCSKDGGIQ
ncbi:hypothetical protein AAVH_23178 [Aphelenchoides avenae]|nr:hypothetical protein AAVH_23178 [Aphelenchus avenae]